MVSDAYTWCRSRLGERKIQKRDPILNRIKELNPNPTLKERTERWNPYLGSSPQLLPPSSGKKG
jgi:hypothetical protein